MILQMLRDGRQVDGMGIEIDAENMIRKINGVDQLSSMRQALGVAVFSGMLGVTFFGLIFTPVFYVLCRKLALIKPKQQQSE